MGNSLMSYRAEIGQFYNRCQRYGRTCKVSISIYVSVYSILSAIRRLGQLTRRTLNFCFSNVHYILMSYTFLSLLLLMCGDIESNPGPPEHCISIIHSTFVVFELNWNLSKIIY